MFSQPMQDNDASKQHFRNRTLENRKEKLAKLFTKNPNKIPIIFEKHKDSKLSINKPDAKFISTRNIKLCEFTKQLRDMWKLRPDTSLFFSCNNSTLLKADALIGQLYEENKDEDGYLYIQYREVETFGNL